MSTASVFQMLETIDGSPGGPDLTKKPKPTKANPRPSSRKPTASAAKKSPSRRRKPRGTKRSHSGKRSGDKNGLLTAIYALFVMALIAVPAGYFYLEAKEFGAAHAATSAQYKKLQKQVAIMTQQNMKAANDLQAAKDQATGSASDDAINPAILQARANDLRVKLQSMAGKSNTSVKVHGQDVIVRVASAKLFDKMEATLTDRGAELALAIAEFGNQLEEYDIAIEGHTNSKSIANDQFGSNWELAAMRAINVLYALQYDGGIKATRLHVRSYGGHKRANDGMAKSHRVELRFKLRQPAK